MTAQFIAFQGALGAYSHLACLAAAPGYTPLPCDDFEDCIAAVHEKRAARALLPVDNTIAGRVAAMHLLLPGSGLHIVGEYFLPVRHCLLGVRGATLADIRAVTSHTHALPQCREFIRAHGWGQIVGPDTAMAARDVARAGDKHMAAIASSLAGEMYGLDVLSNTIADSDDNTTRFLLMAPDAIRPAVDGVDAITSLVFRLASKPAALYHALGSFAARDIDLTKIESYIPHGDPHAADFYCDVAAHGDHADMVAAFGDLARYTQSVQVLGVYAADPARRTARFNF